MSAERLKNPWWLPPFLGRVPVGVDGPQLKLLGVVALALLFEEYDIAMLNLALKQIADDFGVGTDALMGLLWKIRLGAIPAFLLIPHADRIGRRPVFVFSTAMMGLLTFATAFTQTPLQFALCQALTRTFFVAGSAVAFVIVIEEYPAEHRGWGLGILSAIGATGHGAAAGIFAAVPILPFGWRALYVVGLVPMLLVPMFLARIPETERFLDHDRAKRKDEHGERPGALMSTLRPLVALGASNPGRAAGVAMAGFVSAAGMLPTFQLAAYYAQGALQWEPKHVGMMTIGSGAIGIIGNVVAGRAGDLFGRRRVGALFVATFPLMSYLYYNSETTAVIAVAFAGLVFCSMGGRVMLRALSTEMFPTSQRGSSSGVYSVLEQVGGVAGLLMVSRFRVADPAGLSDVLPTAAGVLWLAALAMLLFPETSRRELDSV